MMSTPLLGIQPTGRLLHHAQLRQLYQFDDCVRINNNNNNKRQKNYVICNFDIITDTRKTVILLYSACVNGFRYDYILHNYVMIPALGSSRPLLGIVMDSFV